MKFDIPKTLLTAVPKHKTHFKLVMLTPADVSKVKATSKSAENWIMCLNISHVGNRQKKSKNPKFI